MHKELEMAFGVQGFIFERENKRKKHPKLCLLGNDRSEKISCQRDFCVSIELVFFTSTSNVYYITFRKKSKSVEES